jgi:CheY-like chemotaxis protein
MAKKHVLVVDDSAFIREMIGKILDKLGFDCSKATGYILKDDPMEIMKRLGGLLADL